MFFTIFVKVFFLINISEVLMTFFFFIFVFCEPEFSSCDEFGLRSSNTGGVADNDEATSSRVEGVLFTIFFIRHSLLFSR